MKTWFIYFWIAFLCLLCVLFSPLARSEMRPPLMVSQKPDLAVYDGGWAIDDALSISASKNSKTYWITLEKLEGHYESGMPITTRIKTLSVPITGKNEYIARGRFVCFRKSKGFPDRPIVVLLKRNQPINAWIVSGKDFVKINVSAVTCETEEHAGD
jgi:hypothetical protein